MQQLNPTVAAAIVSTFLQPAVNKFAERASVTGFARLDMGLLADPKNSKSDVVEPALLSRFRTVAESIDPQMRSAKVNDLITFIKAALPSLQLPPISFVDYPERPGKDVVDETTGEIKKTTLKATRASFFGTPPSGLSAAAIATNKRLREELDALIAGS
jgi:hypothetical protein